MFQERCHHSKSPRGRIARRTVGGLFAAVFVSVVSAPAAAATPTWGEQRFTELNEELNARWTSPRAAATLYRLYDLRDHLESLKPLAQILARTSTDRRVRPDVQALARWLHARVALEMGRTAEVPRILEPLTIAAEGWLIGGFDNEGGIGHDTVYPVEVGAIDLLAAHAGKEREIRWQRVPPVGGDGIVPVFELLRPRKNATFYFLTSLQSSSARKALIHLGTSGATRLWVNGQAAFASSEDHPARFDQRSIAVNLRKGDNLVLVKVSGLDQSPSLYLRASAANGQGLSGAKFVAPPQGRPADAGATSPREAGAQLQSAVADDLVGTLARLVQAQPKDGRLREDHATLLDARRPFDARRQLHRREQEKAAELLPGDARAQARVANYVEDDDNLRRRALERALEVDLSYVPARTALGAYYVERGFVRRGHDELSRAVADRPDFPPASLALADALDAMGLEARAQALTFDLAERFETLPQVQLAAARRERALGRLEQAANRYRVALSYRDGHENARSELASVLVSLGLVDAAAAELEKALVHRPTSVSTALRLADLLSFNARPARASAVYDRLLDMVADEDRLYEARGRHRLRNGDQAGAVEDLQHALAIRPQNPRLRELLLAIEPQDNFAAPYLRDGAELAARARATEVPEDEDAIWLADLTVVRVYPNGLSSKLRQEVVQVLTDRGVEAARVRSMRYSPGQQEVRIERARIFKADGSVVEARSEHDRRMTESWSGMYFDSRQRMIGFPNVEPGDVVEFSWRIDDVGQENMFADYFGDVHYLQGNHPREDVEYVLLAPAARAFHANAPNLAGVEHDVEPLGDGTRRWRWRVKDVPRIEPEPGMPGWTEVAAYLHVSTFREWEEVARFWWGLVREQLHATPEVRAAAEEAVAGIPADAVEERVRAVYEYVVRKTRYVGLEFGIHGFKPYAVDRVLARRFGDCKDKASLIKAMLEHLGIPSRLVLIRTRNLGHIGEAPASLAVFNHAILYVPGLDLFLDGTAEFSGASELPTGDEGAQALIVEDSANAPSRFVVTPVSSSEVNVTDSRYTLVLGADGSGRLEGGSEIAGKNASRYRRAYEAESGRREKAEQGFARMYPGVRAATFEMSDPSQLGKAVNTRFVLEVPQLGRGDGAGFSFSPFGEPFRYVASSAPLSRRVHPLETGSPWRNQFHYDIRLPEGFQSADGELLFERTTPFGSYRFQTTVTEGGIELVGHIEVSVIRVEPDEYPAYREFLEDVDRVFSRRLRVVAHPGVRAAVEVP